MGIRKSRTVNVWRAEPRTSVRVTLPDGVVLEGPIGTPLEDFVLSTEADPAAPVMAALVDGSLREADNTGHDRYCHHAGHHARQRWHAHLTAAR